LPIFHSQIAAQAKSPDGKIIQVPPATALQLRGPILQVSLTIEQNAGKGLLAKGQTVPTPRSGLALIDTGASNTCVDEQTAKDLRLPIIDVANMQSASHEKHSCNVYPVQIITPIVTLNAPRAMGAALASQGLLVLIGRDVLQNCNLFYNGPAGQFTLSL
jgi:predicted aspartyl protease